MSILTGKRILVLGEENQHIKELEAALLAQGMTVSVATCGTLDLSTVHADHVDIVLLNHLHDGESCSTLLKHIQSDRILNVLPIFALVEKSEEKIQKALMLGAADYITNDEPISSIISKIKIIFGEPDTFSGSTEIDLTPDHTVASNAHIKVFFIEDDPLLRSLLMTRFEKSNFGYEYSVDGADAVVALLAYKPHVIILDVMLPNRSGLDLLADIRQEPALKDIPVIIFSNRDEQIDQERAKQLGVEHYYVKAMTDLSHLVKTIESLA